MARITVEDCLKRVRSRFALVHLARRRVLQLRRGANPLVHAPKNREIVVALREIAAGKVTFDNVLDFERIESIEHPDIFKKEIPDDLTAAVRKIVDQHRELAHKQLEKNSGTQIKSDSSSIE
ncbi:MAG TPA: DNA-directed RNA polymerase subunit omega [Deltaproteobacteria bacterium]|nr:MAG: DNA-directed RNA polymerase subunit omega [Deltaproteobacteria bacterium]HDM77995.1 DNA-directed RNA polymerase subunit omega [Deltaproteobacteria bacterium]HEC32462.1 DNA-directed RNA polymerase subunit omega [Deltaproteobacteria bacterium]